MKRCAAMLALAAASAACAAALAACAVDQRAEVAEYRRLLDAGAPEGIDLPPAGEALDAKRAMQLANARNEALDVRGENYVRALVDRRRAAAAWLPVITLSPSYFVRDAGSSTVDGVDVPLNATIAVNPKGEAANCERATVEIEHQRALLYEAQDALLLDVARTLFEVLRSERSAAVLRSSLDVQEARVEDVRARRDVGFARPLDVSLSESSAATARVALLASESRARTGRSMLGFLIGADIAEQPLDALLDVPEEDFDPAPLREQALARRQDLRAAELEVETASQEVESASAQWWPSVGVDLSYFLDRDSAPTDQDWSGFLSLHLPLFTGGRIQADVRDSLSRLREATSRRSLARRAVLRDVDVAVENLHASRERIAELRVELATSTEAFAQAEGLYDAGLATNLERLTAQDDQLVTQLALESAELERKVFYLDLLRTTGALHEWIGLLRPDAGGQSDAAPR